MFLCSPKRRKSELFPYEKYDNGYDPYGSYDPCYEDAETARLFSSAAGTRRTLDIPKSKPEPIGVHALMTQLRSCVGQCFPYPIQVRGELSSLSFPATNRHCYFVLKEKQPEAQLNAIVWASSRDRISCPLREGLEVVCTGRLEVSQRFGKCQFIVSDMQPYGVGQFEAEKKMIEERLRRDGLLDPRRKRRLPKFISRVGVVTSRSTAALQDFLKILKQRSKRVDVILSDAKVQGMDAPQEIVKALRALYKHSSALRLDVIALIRGGGSQEDLWAFNDEGIARTIAESPVPLITGVGHEVDTSICDLVSDLRASTPSDAAAQITALDDDSLRFSLELFQSRMTRAIDRRYEAADRQLHDLEQFMKLHDPEALCEQYSHYLDEMERRLNDGVQRRLDYVKHQIEVMKAQLSGRDPKAALARGYSFTQLVDGKKILMNSSEVLPGQIIETTLAHGKIRSVVLETE